MSKRFAVRRNETILGWSQLMNQTTKGARLLESCAKAPHQNIFWVDAYQQEVPEKTWVFIHKIGTFNIL